MKRQLCWAVTAGIALIAGVAGLAVAAEKPVVVRAGNLILNLNGGITPRTLPSDAPVPIGFHANSKLSTVDGSQPPALSEVLVDVDEDVVFDVEGLPVCSFGRLRAQDTAHAVAACKGAILGKGSADVRVAFPEQAPFVSRGPLILYNGGVEGDVITLYLHTYVSVPAPTAVVTTATVSPEHKSPFGTRIFVSVPRVAGGAASVIHTELSARRVYAYRGERHSFLSARCSRGHLIARGTFRFRDGSQITGEALRSCEEGG